MFVQSKRLNGNCNFYIIIFEIKTCISYSSNIDNISDAINVFWWFDTFDQNIWAVIFLTKVTAGVYLLCKNFSVITTSISRLIKTNHWLERKCL